MRAEAERVAFLDCRPHHRALLAEWPELRDRLICHDGVPADEGALIGRLRGARVAMTSATVLSAPILAAVPELRGVVCLGGSAAGVIDMAVAQARGLSVQTVRGYGDRAIAEHAIALGLAGLRAIAAMDRDIRAGNWAAHPGREIEGLRFGVVGMGGIGRATATIAAALGFDVVGWNRSPIGAAPCQMIGIEDLLATSDIVSLHLSLNDATRGFLSAERIAAMRPRAVLVNTARGALVDEPALARALRDGRLSHAALDVLAEEPPPAGHPLVGLANVTLTSHAAFLTPGAARRLLHMGLQQAVALMETLE